MVTKNKEIGRGFLNKFGMTDLKFRMTSLKFGFILLIVLFLNSCSFYAELRDNPRFKDGITPAPESFTGIVSTEANGIVTLEWSQVEGAAKYEIYCIKENDGSGNFDNYIKENAKLIYTFNASHIKNNKPRLEVSNLVRITYYRFFIRSVSQTGIPSIFSTNYVRIYSGNTGNDDDSLVVFREL